MTAGTVAYGVATGVLGEGAGTAVADGVCSLGVGGSVNPGGPKSLALLVGAGVGGGGGGEEGGGGGVELAVLGCGVASDGGEIKV